MLQRQVWTRDLIPEYCGPKATLGSVLVDEREVGEEF